MKMQNTQARILLVDDDPLILTTLGRGLEQRGYDVTTADEAEEAISAVQGKSLDMAILDVRMEGKSGLEVARYISEHSVVPFIFLSAYGDDEVVRLAVAEGALCYLVKPIELDQIIPVIKAAMERGREIHQLRERQDQLKNALEGDRIVSVAIGIIMERFTLAEREAFESLRSRARNERRKLVHIARELVQAEEVLACAGSKPSKT